MKNETTENNSPDYEITLRFISKIIEVEKKRKLTNAAVCESIGMLAQRFSKMKKHPEVNHPSLNDCHNLCKEFQVSEAWLLSGKLTDTEKGIYVLENLEKVSAAVKDIDEILKTLSQK